jgi:DNA polymerase-3 subunit gamma/tau
MAHAQRLLPLEQLLSDAAASASGPARTLSRPVLALPTEARRSEPVTPARSSTVSPFAADSARKGAPKAEFSGATSGTSANLVIMGSAAPAVEESSPAPDPESSERAEAKTEIRPQTKTEANAESLRDAVLNALANQQMLVSLLDNAEWRLEGNALIAKVAASSTMIEMSFTGDARRIASAAASGLAGRPIKMLVEPGEAPQAMSAPRRSPSKSTGSARSRAEQDPIVQRMQEKFGAEIRTVIDYREK